MPYHHALSKAPQKQLGKLTDEPAKIKTSVDFLVQHGRQYRPSIHYLRGVICKLMVPAIVGK